MLEQNKNSRHTRSVAQDWCPSCVHRWKYTDQEPCHECLSFIVNTEKPLHYKSGGNSDG